MLESAFCYCHSSYRKEIKLTLLMNTCNQRSLKYMAGSGFVNNCSPIVDNQDPIARLAQYHAGIVLVHSIRAMNSTYQTKTLDLVCPPY